MSGLLPRPPAGSPERVHAGRRTLVFRATGPAGEGWLVKTPAAPIPSADAVATQREEARLLTRLAGPGLPRLLELREGRGTVQLVMRDTGARALSTLAGPQDIATVIDILDGAAAALGRLHEAGLVHRDVHPGNLCWGGAGGVLLIDLGLAAPPSAPGTGRGGGTLRTLPPEQTGRTRLGVDHRADLYSLGAVAFELLTGRPVFETTTPLTLLHAHLARRPPDLGALRPDAPPDLVRVVQRLLEKAPDRRYAGAHGLRADLGRIRAGDRGFPLGTDDPAPLFALTDRLFGQEEERSALEAALDDTCAGAHRVVTLEGPAGSGKSSLAARLGEAARARGVRFVRGGFDGEGQHHPLAAIRTACGALLDEVEPDEVGPLAEALGPLASPLAVVLPGLHTVLGPQPPPPEVSPRQAAARSLRGMLALLGALSSPTRPLVLLLDDLHRGRGALTAHVEALVADQGLPGLLVLLAPRDDELDDSQALLAVLQAVGAVPGDRRLRLAPLSEADARALVGATLHRAPGSVRPLAAALHRATGGNPEAMRSQLSALHDQGLIVRDGPRWTWLPEALDEVDPADEVLDLLLLGIDRLPIDAHAALQAAAVMGARFELGILSTALRWPPGRLVPALESCVSRGLITAESAEWAHARHADAVGLPAGQPGTWLRFTHTRVRVAAQAEVARARRVALHLHTGRCLHRQARGDAWLEAAAAPHLRAALHRIEPTGERLAIADLAERVARRAVASGSSEKALRGLSLAEAAIGTRDADRWERVASLAAEVAAGADRPTELALWRDRLDDRARTLAATAPGVAAHVEAAARHGRLEEAVRVAASFLARAGAPQTDRLRPLGLLGALASLLWSWRGRAPESLARAPVAADPLARAIARVQSACALPHSTTTPRAVPEEMLRNAAHLLRVGPVPEGAMGYTGWAIALSYGLGRVHLGARFGELARSVAERPGGETSITAVCGVVDLALLPLVRPLDEVLRTVGDDARRGLALGDVTHAAALIAGGHQIRMVVGTPLPELASAITADRGLLRRLAATRGVEMLDRLADQVAALRGLPPPSPPEAQPAHAPAVDVQRARHQWAAEMLHACFGAAPTDRALEVIRRDRPHPGYPVSVPIEHLAAACRSVLAAQLRAQAHLDARHARRLHDEARRALRFWDRGTGTRGHLRAWVDGARALHGGDPAAALPLLEAASRGAWAQHARHVAAHAAALAAEAAAGLGREVDALTLARRAHDLYVQWGGTPAADALATRWPGLRPPTPVIGASSSADGFEALVRAEAEELSEQPGGRSALPALLERTLRVAGATWACLLVHDGAGWRPVAATGRDGRTETPAGLIRAADAGHAGLVVDDALAAAPHRTDPVVQRHHVRAALVLPLPGGTARLYLENNLVPAAFSEADLRTLAQGAAAMLRALGTPG